MPEPRHAGEVAGTRWSPSQYARFADHRSRPALELLERIPIESPRVVYDVGCGTGEITQLMAERWPSAAVFGLDHSPQMLERAAVVSSGVRWIESDIEGWVPEVTPDLVYSNAALHWVGGHETLFPRLVSCLSPGGCLAVQMPLSWHAPSHRLMRETLEDGGTGGRPLGTAELRRAMGRSWVEDSAFYYEHLAAVAGHLDIWETEYLQVLQGDDPVLEWVSGTGLRPIMNGLGDDDRAVFLDAYRRRLRVAYPPRDDGHTLYPFRRLFIVAAR